MKILYVVQNFRQGWGGAPESVRLMARQLAPLGYSSDVFDLGRFHGSVERLELLPELGKAGEAFPIERMQDYGAILLAGPWQNPVKVASVLKARRRHQRLFYLPRGGLARTDFSRLRDLKKVPYFHLVERRLLDRSDGIIFSSTREREDAIRAARSRAPEFIIPDMFDGVSFSGADAARSERKITFSFLAEISPLKGLAPLVEAFGRWSAANNMVDTARLVVGGRVRPGSERYLGRVKAMCEQYRGAAAIEFVGAVAHSDRPRFYGATDIMVIPSRGESFGLTLLEALSAGSAVVACPNVGALEYVPEHDRLRVTESSDSGAIEHGIAAMFEKVKFTSTSDRVRTRDFAAGVVTRLNARALDAWDGLLRPA